MLQKHYTSMHPIKAYIYARYCARNSTITLHVDMEIKVLKASTSIQYIDFR